MSVVDKILEQEQATTFEEAAQRNVVDEMVVTTAPTIAGLAPSQPLGQVSTRPTIRTVPGEGVGFVESFKQGFIEDPWIRMQRIAQEKFPDDPKALDRFGMIDGDIVFVNEDGELERALSGKTDAAGSIASMTPEIAGSIIGSFATAPGAATGMPLLGSAIGASGGKAFKELIGGFVFEDPKTTVGVLTDMGIEFAADLTAGLVGKGIAKMKKAGRVESLNVDDLAKHQAKRAEIEAATGIELDLAMVSNHPLVKNMKKWAAKFPGQAGEVIRANDEVIAGQVDKAVQRLVRTISTTESATMQGFKGMNAAKAAIEAARVSVSDITGPLYRRAFNSNAVVNIDPVMEAIEQNVKVAKGPALQQWNEVRKWMNAGNALDTSVQGLHGTKLAIDTALETGKLGDTSMGRTFRANLIDVKNKLMDQISEVSPDYKQARIAHDRLTESWVEPLRDGVVGALAKLDDANAAKIGAKMFSGGNVSPLEIRIARAAIERTEGGKEAWSGIVRNWLEDQFVRASRELQIGQEANIAGKFRQRVFGTRRQKAAMSEALGKDAREMFEVTMEALQFAASTPLAMSDTQSQQEIRRILLGSIGSARRFAFQPRQVSATAIEERFLNKQAMLLAEALTDPSKAEQLRVLAQLPPSRERRIIAASIIGLSILPRDALGQVIWPESDITPPMLQ